VVPRPGAIVPARSATLGGWAKGPVSSCLNGKHALRTRVRDQEQPVLAEAERTDRLEAEPAGPGRIEQRRSREWKRQGERGRGHERGRFHIRNAMENEISGEVEYPISKHGSTAQPRFRKGLGSHKGAKTQRIWWETKFGELAGSLWKGAGLPAQNLWEPASSSCLSGFVRGFDCPF